MTGVVRGQGLTFGSGVAGAMAAVAAAATRWRSLSHKALQGRKSAPWAEDFGHARAWTRSFCWRPTCFVDPRCLFGGWFGDCYGNLRTTLVSIKHQHRKTLLPPKHTPS
eukprot:314412-Rhodomonas_salina.2